MSRIAVVIGCAALLAGCAATPEEIARSDASTARELARLEKRLAGLVPGEPQSCVPYSQLRGSNSYGQTILYQQGTRSFYRNDTSPGCRIGRDDILVTQTPIGQLCRGDIVTLVDRNTRLPNGACALGEFVPYRAPSQSEAG